MKKYGIISIVIYLLFSNLLFLAADSLIAERNEMLPALFSIYFAAATLVPLSSLIVLVSGIVVSASQPNHLTKSLSAVYGITVCVYVVMAVTSGFSYDPDWLFYTYSALFDWGVSWFSFGLVDLTLCFAGVYCLVNNRKDV